MLYNITHRVNILALNLEKRNGKEMKNIIKKITAAAMAFTLLGAGTAAIKTAAPQTNNTLVANAACTHNTPWESYWKTEYYVEYLPSYYVSGKGLCKPERHYYYIDGWKGCETCRTKYSQPRTYGNYVINRFV